MLSLVRARSNLLKLWPCPGGAGAGALCQPLLALLILRFLCSELVPLGVGALLALCALLALLCLFQALLALLHLFGRSGNSQYLV